MSRFRNMRILYKLLLIIGLMVSFLLINGLTGLVFIHRMNSALEGMFQKNTEGLREIQEMERLALDTQVAVTNLLFNSPGSKSGEMHRNTLTSNIQEMEDMMGGTPGKLSQESRRKSFEKLGPVWQRTSAALEQAVRSSSGTSLEQREENYAAYKVENSGFLLVLDEFRTEGFNQGLYALVDTRKMYRTMSLITWILLCGLIGLGGSFALITARRMDRDLQAIRVSADQMARGDLTHEVCVFSRDEIGRVAASYNAALKSLGLLLGKVDDAARSISEASRELADGANETGKAIGQVTSAISELSHGAEDQAQSVNKAVEVISEVSGLIRCVTEDITKISHAAAGMANTAQNGQQAVGSLTEEMETTFGAVQNTSRIVQMLAGQSQRIGEIMGAINEIASQASLVSLNASIEAARAGAAGTGFTVVAVEIGKLAEKTRLAAEEIGLVTAGVQDRMNEAASAMSEGAASVERSTVLAGTAISGFNNVMSELNRFMAEIAKVADSTGRMGNENDKMIAAVENIACITQENLAGITEVSAATEEQSASTEEIFSAAAELAGVASELERAIVRFRITR